MAVSRAPFPILVRVLMRPPAASRQPPALLLANRSPVSRPPAGKPKLLDQWGEALRSRHYRGRTEQTDCRWIKRFIFFPPARHPAAMAKSIGRNR